MLKFKKKPTVYTMNDNPLTKEQLLNYPNFSKFFVWNSGIVTYIPPEIPLSDQLKYLNGGKFIYKEELESLIS